MKRGTPTKCLLISYFINKKLWSGNKDFNFRILQQRIQKRKRIIFYKENVKIRICDTRPFYVFQKKMAAHENLLYEESFKKNNFLIFSLRIKKYLKYSYGS